VVLAQPACATITYSESVSSITSSILNQPKFTGLASFSNNSLNSPVIENPFFTGTPKASGSGTVNSTVTVKFSFSDSGTGTGSLAETGTFFANYTNQTDWIIWAGEIGGTGTEQTGGIATLDVTLSDKAMIRAQVYDAQDWNITPKAVFTLIDTPAVPEPTSLAVLGTASRGWGCSGRAVAVAVTREPPCEKPRGRSLPVGSLRTKRGAAISGTDLLPPGRPGFTRHAFGNLPQASLEPGSEGVELGIPVEIVAPALVQIVGGKGAAVFL